jgi:hypothetical protein
MRRLIMLVVSASMLAGLAVVVPSVVTPAKAPQAQAEVFIDGQKWASEQAVKTAAQRMFGPYDIDANRACRDQYGGGAWAWPLSWSNPYTWRCYRVISWVPYRVAYLGGLDLNAYCLRYHGSWAYVREPWKGASGWSCGGWYEGPRPRA